MFALQTKPKKQLEREIIEFLDKTCGLPDHKPGKHSCGMLHRNCLVLSTSYKDAPRATPLEFFHEDLTIYIFGEPGGKIANIKRNKKVCAAVYEQPLDHSKHQKSLQIFGTAELLSMESDPDIFKAKAKKWNLYAVINKFVQAVTKGKESSARESKELAEKLLLSINMIKITPYHIIVREYHPDGIMPKYEWEE